ncbi:Fpg/Nei family DNA glycosylase [Enemella sp. A6]|uniref:Fpg/Nei family DNA glycosylase n=1 Tax=Enemella sp. A6 TaxID=3440152 RepID=UPI003EBC96D9
MPELPEVEALRSHLAERCAGRTVTRADPAAIAALKTYDPPLTALIGGTVDEVCRFGKFLAWSVLVDEQPHWLVVHLARAGWVRTGPTPAKPPRLGGKGPLLLRIGFDDDTCVEITEAGTQRHAAIWVVHDPGEIPLLAELGPDPLADSFDADALGEILAGQGRTRIKTVLRDQRLIAGIGNAWSDEILHTAKMSPYTPANSLDAGGVEHLWTVLRQVLQEAADRADGVEPTDLKDTKRSGMRVHGRTGEACPVCGDTVAEVSFSDSSWQYCPTCQTDGKPLADRRMSRLLK